MFYVGLVRRMQPGTLKFFIRVRSEPFAFKCVAFNEKRARVAVRRFIKGNLSVALGPVAARNKQEARDLRRRLMIPGSGPGGFEVDYGDCRK